MSVPNALYEVLADGNIMNKRSVWIKKAQESPNNFPELTLEDIKEITLGSYQIQMGAQYAREIVSTPKGFEFYNHKYVGGILWAKIPSRFHSRKFHEAFVQYDPSKTGAESIEGWYCGCQTGMRTVGCCSHVATVLWYFGYFRNSSDAKMPEKKFMKYILDASNPAMMEESSSGEESDEES
jgi:hypothetical protein